METPARHDAALCHCGCDTVEPREGGPACHCPCGACRKRREKIITGWRLYELDIRLKRAGIHPEELAVLIFSQLDPLLKMRIDQLVDERMKKLVNDAVAQRLKKVKVIL